MEKNSTTLPAVSDLSKLDRLLRPAVVAQILDVSASFVYRLIREGVLPAVRLGTAVRVHPAALANYIDKFPFEAKAYSQATKINEEKRCKHC